MLDIEAVIRSRRPLPPTPQANADLSNLKKNLISTEQPGEYFRLAALFFRTEGFCTSPLDRRAGLKAILKLSDSLLTSGKAEEFRFTGFANAGLR